MNTNTGLSLNLSGSIVTLSVDGQPLGLITSLNVAADSSNATPVIRVGVLEGMAEDTFKAASHAVQGSARTTVSKLKQFPNVQLVCPDYLA